jgi:hypothetical protein
VWEWRWTHQSPSHHQDKRLAMFKDTYSYLCLHRPDLHYPKVFMTQALHQRL